MSLRESFAEAGEKREQREVVKLVALGRVDVDEAALQREVRDRSKDRAKEWTESAEYKTL